MDVSIHVLLEWDPSAMIIVVYLPNLASCIALRILLVLTRSGWDLWRVRTRNHGWHHSSIVNNANLFDTSSQDLNKLGIGCSGRGSNPVPYAPCQPTQVVQ